MYLELRLIYCTYVFRFILGDVYYHGQDLGMEVRSEIGFSPTLTSSANLDMLLASVSLTSPPCLVGDECMSLSVTVQFKQLMCKVLDSEQVINYYLFIPSIPQSTSLMLLSWSSNGTNISSVRSHVQSDFATF